ncbi:MAG: ferredoxin:glutaredoxin reductase [Nitrososphaeria archaeon]|nr:ferredoxin:glutaredoxin reductase [Nitrososphaeria archaeon]NIQ33306.1 ferredoxin:glutaredoxin reductase [Nitrososphaeria archaeon]
MTDLKKERQRAESDARTHGYYLNPDAATLEALLEGLKRNEERYGYPSCPCRLASGKFEFDRDIVCPCDYRDPDVEEFGHCYCTLYVRKDVFEGKTPFAPIPERRPSEKQSRAYRLDIEETKTVDNDSKTKMKMWYCRQCGYVCFREDPPYVCPICKAKREMFSEIIINTDFQG